VVPIRWNLSPLRRNVPVGTAALRAHRLRSALTTLGVVFGVAAVICMLAIGKGAEKRVLEELRRLGIRNLHVEARTAEPAGRASSGLVEEDAQAMVTELGPFVRGAAPERAVDRRALCDGRAADARLCGVTPVYARYLDLEMVEGRFVSDLDQRSREAVCVLSEPLRAALLPGRQALGARVRCAGLALRVVGVARGGALTAGERPQLFVPLALAHAVLPAERDPREVQRIVVRIGPDADPTAFGEVLESILARRHGGTRDFAVVVPEELIRKEQRTQRVFQMVMGGIAGISLLVGGIGIANILFANVVERTSEIGLRRAVGARRIDITTQFLFEAVVIGAVGGLVGIVLGVGGALAVARTADWPVLVTPGSILLSTGTALATGLVAGWVPARAAARVDAIVALHHE
jgi:putative ABC transport system permease protein